MYTPYTTNQWHSAAPFGDTWHDVQAFNRNYTTTQYVSTDGTNFSSETLELGLFAQQDKSVYEVIGNGERAVRWKFYGVAYNVARYFQIASTYYSPAASCTVKIEISSDDSSWTEVHSSSGISFSASSRYYWVDPYIGNGGAQYVRVTIDKGDSGTKLVRLSSIKMLSQRLGDQGKGSEDAYPYTWDKNRNMTVGNDLTVSGGDITLGGTGRIQGIDTVSAGTDAANKTYVDNAVIANTDTQDLSISGRTISLTDGGSVTVPAPTYSSITGKPTTFAPTIGTTSTTAMAGNTSIPSISGLASETYVDTAVSNLIDNAPANLNTLNELAEALNDDDDAIVTINTALGNRVRVDTASQGLTSTQKSNARTNIGAQASGTYNTQIGTDSDITTSGATVVDDIYMTDGVVTSHTTRTLTLSDLGYSAPTTVSGAAGTAAKLTATSGITTQPGTNNLIYSGQISSGTAGLFAASDNSNSIITLNRHSGNYDSQLGFSSNGNIYYRKKSNTTNNLQAWKVLAFTDNANMLNSNVTLSSLGAQAAGSYLTSHQDISGKLNLSGGTMSGAIAMGNQNITGVNEIEFDDGFKLFGGGNNNYLKAKAANTTNGGIIFQDGDSETMGYLYWDGSSTANFGFLDGTGSWAVRCRENEYVQLYYDNAAKLITKSDGVDITGELQADSLDIDGNADISGNVVVGGTITSEKLVTDTAAIEEDNETDAALMTLTGQGAGTQNNIGLRLVGTTASDGTIKIKLNAMNNAGTPALTGAGLISYYGGGDTMGIGQSTTHNNMAILIDNSENVTLNGTLTLSGAPTNNLHAATKAYVDGAVIANTDTQDLSISGTTLSLTNSPDVTIPQRAVSDSTSTTSSTTAASSTAVKSAYDRGSTGITNAANAQTTATAALPKSGGSMSGNLLMGNGNITGVNMLEFNDAGPSEGIQWNGGNMKLYESPNDLTTNTAGNLKSYMVQLED